LRQREGGHNKTVEDNSVCAPRNPGGPLSSWRSSRSVSPLALAGQDEC
jgi:hypothetical protein